MLEYRYKFYLNAMHSISINGVMGEMHPHTWEIVVDVFKQNKNFMEFSQIEKEVESMLSEFQNKNMNSIPPFDTLNPTLENVSIFLQNNLDNLFVENGFILSRLEVSETPTRSFIIDITNEKKEDTEIAFTQDMSIIEKKADELLNEKINEMGNYNKEEEKQESEQIHFSPKKRKWFKWRK